MIGRYATQYVGICTTDVKCQIIISSDAIALFQCNAIRVGSENMVDFSSDDFILIKKEICIILYY